jgi:predicted RNase H-like HicB family nuclease
MHPSRKLELKVQLDCEVDGRWIAECVDLPGVVAYGRSREDAVERVKELAAKVMSDRMQNGEDPI